ncbi:hypothetical protein ACMFMF_004284 [Clarireedia jacksonii]
MSGKKVKEALECIEYESSSKRWRPAKEYYYDHKDEEKERRTKTQHLYAVSSTNLEGNKAGYNYRRDLFGLGKEEEKEKEKEDEDEDEGEEEEQERTATERGRDPSLTSGKLRGNRSDETRTATK